MITAGERLRQLAGRDGPAWELLRALAPGATAGAVLVNYSGTVAGSAAARMLIDRVAALDWFAMFGGAVQRKSTSAKKRKKDIDVLVLTAISL